MMERDRSRSFIYSFIIRQVESNQSSCGSRRVDGRLVFDLQKRIIKYTIANYDWKQSTDFTDSRYSGAIESHMKPHAARGSFH